MIAFIYYGTIILLLIYLISIFFYTCALIVSALDGAPYVKTDKNVRQKIFSQAHISKKSYVIEIGSGSGELATYIQKTYQCKVVGIEANPLLYLISRIRNGLFGSKNIQFKRTDAVMFDYSQASHIYVFLFPPIIRKLTPTLKRTCSKDTIVISYGFCIPSFKKYLMNKNDAKPYPVYYYKL